MIHCFRNHHYIVHWCNYILWQNSCMYCSANIFCTVVVFMYCRCLEMTDCWCLKCTCNLLLSIQPHFKHIMLWPLTHPSKVVTPKAARTSEAIHSPGPAPAALTRSAGRLLPPASFPQLIIVLLCASARYCHIQPRNLTYKLQHHENDLGVLSFGCRETLVSHLCYLTNNLHQHEKDVVVFAFHSATVICWWCGNV
jgi:hypothetical protein